MQYSLSLSRISDEIANIDIQMRELSSKREELLVRFTSYQNQFKKPETSLIDAKRASTIYRLSVILEYLSDRPYGLTSKELYNSLKKHGYKIKYGTLRADLSRFSSNNKIEQSKRGGRWRLIKKHLA